jgi:hypothetical protein
MPRLLFWFIVLMVYAIGVAIVVMTPTVGHLNRLYALFGTLMMFVAVGVFIWYLTPRIRE